MVPVVDAAEVLFNQKNESRLLIFKARWMQKYPIVESDNDTNVNVFVNFFILRFRE